MNFFVPSWAGHLLIVSIAMLVRGFLAYIFFGSVDVPCFISMTHCTLHHDLLAFPMWNYVPVLTYFLWLVGFLTVKTSLPLAFCIKVIPIFFDSLLASLIVSIMQKTKPTQAWLSGLAYALCPISIIITAIHGQWDALFLFFLIVSFYVRDFFLDSAVKFFWFGFIFGLSLLIKPASLIFLPFFFTPYKNFSQKMGLLWRAGIWSCALGSMLFAGFFCMFKVLKCSLTIVKTPIFLSISLLACISYLVVLAVLLAQFDWKNLPKEIAAYLKNQIAALLGFMTILSLVFGVLVWYGFDLIKLLDTILRYCNQGVQVLGLPFCPLIQDTFVATILKNRILFLGGIGVLAGFYYHERVHVMKAILIILALLFGLSGICPQYLMWLVPFLLITRMYYFALLYNFIATFFLGFFYANPWSNPVVPYQNMLSFAALKSWSWFTPPTILASEQLAGDIQLLGNCAIPLVCLAIAFYAWQRKKYSPLRNATSYSPWLDGYLMAPACVVTGIFFLRCFFDFDQALPSFIQQSKLVLARYAVTAVHGKPCAIFEGYAVCNVITFLGILLFLYCIVISVLTKKGSDTYK